MYETWRQWVYGTLNGEEEILSRLPGGLHAAGSLQGTPPAERPFAVIRIGATVKELGGEDDPPVISKNAMVIIHDQPGSYTRIEEALALVRQALEGPVSDLPSAVACVWQGDSGELPDDVYGTILKEGSYKLVGGPHG